MTEKELKIIEFKKDLHALLVKYNAEIHFNHDIDDACDYMYDKHFLFCLNVSNRNQDIGANITIRNIF